ncbi:hypothetical protein [Leekyejoonella antrihumi]|uniref:Uncharacterized protein n=1 Tax=Leekyejoonella antrihumi TaxID=1660198 RepID=A0A563DVW9_9MICO|nr:hypothetical protein [Leekyejoonella antrihumi]TWP34420.1 hypothetical protein FGL98_17780 [Leekyejoonella antrihumi]
MAMSGHHVEADEGNVASQMARVRRISILTQPEPPQQPLFGAEVVEPTTYAREALRAKLTGITDLPKFERVSAAEVLKHQDEIRKVLREHSKRIEKDELDYWLPPVAARDADAANHGSGNNRVVAEDLKKLLEQP